MRLANRIRPNLEALNDRIAPATFTSSSVGGTLVITQVDAAVGGIIISDDPGAGTVTIDDIADANPATVVSTAGLGSLKINLKSTDATPVLYDIASARGGSVALNFNNTAPRLLLLNGGFMIGGNFNVTGGNGGLSILETVAPLMVGGNATFKGGSGSDLLNLTTVGGTSIGGNLKMIKFNGAGTNAGDAVGGNLIFDAAGESSPTVLFLMDSEIGGNLKVVGGTRADNISLGGAVGTTIHGNVNVNFGGQLPADVSIFMQAAAPSSKIGGNVKIAGGNLGTETAGLLGEVDGNVRFNMGSGTNSAGITGLFHGSSVKYTGGAGLDMLMWNPLAGSSSAKLKAILGAGADTVLFGPGVDPSSAIIDFGSGIDSVVGVVDFAVTFLNLP